MIASSRRVLSAVTIVSSLCLLPLAASAADPTAAFIYVGPVGDAGWSYRHDQGRQCIEKDGIKTSFVESVPQAADVANIERDFLGQGFSMIFATAFGYQPFTQQVAKENPEKFFFGITPTIAPADNILNYYGKLWDGRYLTGMVAGAMTKTNKIGFVAAVPIPTVIAGLNAFALGARAVNPKAEVQVVWTLSWYDPPAEKQAAVALVEGGADVVGQHQDTPSPVQGAAEKGAWAIGSESDMTSFAPEKYLTGTVWDWCPFYKKAVAMVKDGSFKPGEFYGGLDDGTVSLAPLNKAVPADIAAKVEEARTGIVAGTLDYWKGPLKDNQGAVVVEDGKTLAISDINNMKWLVEGVIGKIPSQ
ncbi:MAG: BMP family ABC transporter substrate-binding protein [Parvibaculaceae bacterium]